MLARHVRRLLTVAVAGVAACVAAAPAAAEITVLRNVTLFDGTGKAPKRSQALVIGNDGKVSWVGPVGRLRVPAGATVTDLTGKFVMPGLIDLHVHVGNVVDVNQNKDFFSKETVEKDLRTFASYGVTTVQILGTDGDLIFPLRAAQRSGRPTYSRIYTSGQGLVFKGGYGGVPGLNNQVATPAEAVAEVNRQADKGVDFIKLWLDDELKTMPPMPPEISKAIIDAAHARGLRAVGHIFYLDDAKRLVSQGIDALAHSVRDKPVDQELIDMMKSRGVWQVAETLSREASLFTYVGNSPLLKDPFFTASMTERDRAVLTDPAREERIRGQAHFHDLPKFLDMAIANTGRLSKAGVKWAFGTDAGPPARFPGSYDHWELELMTKSGATPIKALHTATGIAAEYLGNKQIGVLEPGRWGDILVLDADPTVNILNSRKINSVYLAGQKVPSVRY